MNKPSYTPGPWIIGEDSTTSVLALRADGRPVPVALCYDPNDHSHRTVVGEANARLIAAAPEMAEAIKGYLEWGAMTSSDRDLHEARFENVLKKAGLL